MNRSAFSAVVLAVASFFWFGQDISEGGDDAAPGAVDVPGAVATSGSEMKPYDEPIEHTDLSIAMVPIRGGRFTMGSPDGEPDRGADEEPRRDVEVSPFWMSKFEITWDQYDTWGEGMDQLRRQMFSRPASPRDLLVDGVTKPTEPYTDMSFGMGKGNQPAICMTQHAARTFCRWLSTKTGRYYRLPTEAEWEYACRAGTTTAYSFGDDVGELDAYAWHFDNSDGRYHDVGQKLPNPWGLHDMHGNVAEWVLDQYAPDYGPAAAGISGAAGEVTTVKDPLRVPTELYPRVVRGGSWDDDPDRLRSAARVASEEAWKDQDPQIPQSIWYHTDALGVGFRVVRPLAEPSAEEKATKWEKTEPEQLDPP